MTPRFSVLLPTRNGASLLEGTLRSVLDQPYEDFELVITDNASDDGTRRDLAERGGRPAPARPAPARAARRHRQLERRAGGRAAASASCSLGDDDAHARRATSSVPTSCSPRTASPTSCSTTPTPSRSRASRARRGRHWADPFYTPDPEVPARGRAPAGAAARARRRPLPLPVPDPPEHADGARGPRRVAAPARRPVQAAVPGLLRPDRAHAAGAAVGDLARAAGRGRRLAEVLRAHRQLGGLRGGRARTTSGSTRSSPATCPAARS